MKTCSTQHSDGSFCSRAPYRGHSHCIFHLPVEHRDDSHQRRFAASFRRLVRLKDGNWNDFIFPDAFEAKGVEIDFPVALQNAHFGSLSLEGVVFAEPISAMGIHCSKEVQLQSCRFDNFVAATKSRFEGPFRCNSEFNSACDLNSSEFLSRAEYLGSFNKRAGFSNCTFYDSVFFRGTRTIVVSLSAPISFGFVGNSALLTHHPADESITQRVLRFSRNAYHLLKRKLSSAKKKIRKWASSKRRSTMKGLRDFRDRLKFVLFKKTNRSDTVHWLFNDEVQFEYVDFRMPGKVRFFGVDMRRAYIMGTDFRGVRFYDVAWHQERLKRNGVYDEIQIHFGRDYSHILDRTPKVEEACRNLRIALEEGKNYRLASDFFIGEMELRRSAKGIVGRHFLSIEAWYRALSRYGTSPGTAIRMLAWLLLGHALAIGYAAAPVAESYALPLSTNQIISFLQDIWVNKLGLIALHASNTLNVLTISKSYAPGFSGMPFDIINSLFRILFALQAALIVLSVRSRIKRH